MKALVGPANLSVSACRLLPSTVLRHIPEQCTENYGIRPFSLRKRAFEGNNGVRDITLLIGWGVSGLSQNSTYFFCG